MWYYYMLFLCAFMPQLHGMEIEKETTITDMIIKLYGKVCHEAPRMGIGKEFKLPNIEMYVTNEDDILNIKTTIWFRDVARLSSYYCTHEKLMSKCEILKKVEEIMKQKASSWTELKHINPLLCLDEYTKCYRPILVEESKKYYLELETFVNKQELAVLTKEE